MTEEQLSALERECVDHFLRWLRGFTTAREMWYLIALEQEHAASREALQMMEHVGSCNKIGCSQRPLYPYDGVFYCAEHLDELHPGAREKQPAASEEQP